MVGQAETSRQAMGRPSPGILAPGPIGPNPSVSPLLSRPGGEEEPKRTIGGPRPKRIGGGEGPRIEEGGRVWLNDLVDLFVIRGIVRELRNALLGGFISKIYQINRTDLLFHTRRGGEEKRLLISTHPHFYRLHLTQKKYPNPPVPPRFCRYLRKHTLGGRWVDIQQDPYERIVRFFLEKRMDAGALRRLVLVVELAGKGSNVLLLEGETILDCLHFRKAEEGATRVQIPRLPYTPPPPRGWRLDQVTLERIREIFATHEEPWKGLMERIAGISPLWAREIDLRSDRTPEGCWKAFQEIRGRYEREEFEPLVATEPSGKKILAPFPLGSFEGIPQEAFSSLNQAAEAVYFETVTARQMAEQKQAILKRLRQLLLRLQRRRENLFSERERFEKDLACKDLGDLLLAHYGRLRKGMTQVEVQDLKNDPPRSRLIPLDPALDPSGNVGRYFKAYKKAKRGLEILDRRIETTDQEISYLESSIFQVEEAADSAELAAIRKELEEEKILPAPSGGKKRKEKREWPLPVRRLRSSEGLEILCGKSNMGNEYLLRHLARGKDLWFHAQGIPGAHVVLKVGKGEPPFASVLEAATAAAYFSRGRHSTRLPVDYTEVMHVRRPKGAPPGTVRYFHAKTLYVAPDPERIQKLEIPDR
jgi:predicted ribosome quality control (RQC) complex YloA/Tae2 family protein